MPVLDNPVAVEAKGLFPETWAALAESKNFGEDALQRRFERVTRKIFGVVPTPEEQDVFDDVVIEYVGKRLAYTLLDAAIDYWSRQVLTRTAGDRESSTYKDRAEDLRLAKKDWPAELSDMWLDVAELMPTRPGRAADAPRVIQAGETVAHVTAQPFDLDPAYGPKDTTAAT